MRVKVLGSVVAVGVALVALTSAKEVQADPDPQTLVSVTCAGGVATAKGLSGWHTNAQAPWKWTQDAAPGSAVIGEKVSVDEHEAKFKRTGGATTCTGVVKAYICSGEKCLGPIAKTVQ